MFGSDRNNWPEAMKNALGLHHDGGFPYQLSINNRPPEPIPVIDFSKNIQPNIGEALLLFFIILILYLFAIYTTFYNARWK